MILNLICSQKFFNKNIQLQKEKCHLNKFPVKDLEAKMCPKDARTEQTTLLYSFPKSVSLNIRRKHEFLMNGLISIPQKIFLVNFYILWKFNKIKRRNFMFPYMKGHFSAYCNILSPFDDFKLILWFVIFFYFCSLPEF